MKKGKDQFQVGPILAAPDRQNEGRNGDKPVVARLNAGVARFQDGSTFLTVRANTDFPNGHGPDETGWIEGKIISADGQNSQDLKLFLKGTLPPPLDQVEDTRNYVNKKGEAMLLMTGVVKCEDKFEVYPTISVAKLPLDEKSVSPPQIIEGLPQGKGAGIIEEDGRIYKGFYRQADPKLSRALIPFTCQLDSDGRWRGEVINKPQEIRSPWAKDYVGLTGCTKIPVKGSTDYVLLLHGINMERRWSRVLKRTLKKVPLLNSNGNGHNGTSSVFQKIPVYSIFPALFNKSGEFIRAGKPVLTYAAVKKACREDSYPLYHDGEKDPIYLCDYWLDNVKGTVDMPTTIDDTYIRWFSSHEKQIYKNLDLAA